MSGEDEISKLGFFQVYWRLYGGFPALVLSRYLWAAHFFSSVCAPVWAVREAEQRTWLDNATQIIPSMLAFSLSGLAILLAFSNERLLRAVQQGGASDSHYMKVVAAFFHFILVQVVALCAVFLAQGYHNDFVSWFAFWMMIYGMFSAIAVGGDILKLAQIFNLQESRPRSNK